LLLPIACEYSHRIIGRFPLPALAQATISLMAGYMGHTTSVARCPLSQLLSKKEMAPS
jgi:hypothetical protein